MTIKISFSKLLDLVCFSSKLFCSSFTFFERVFKL